MDKSKLKQMVQAMSESERDELGKLLLESVLERWSEETELGDDGQRLGDFDVILEKDANETPSDPASDPRPEPDDEPSDA